MKKILLIIVPLFISIISVLAEQKNNNDLHIYQAYIKPTDTIERPTVAYMKIENTGTTDDTLLSVNIDNVTNTQIHEMTINDNGVMSMNHLKNGVTIPAGKMIELKPHGLHLMLMGLTKPLINNTEMIAKLKFAKAGLKNITIKVKDSL